MSTTDAQAQLYTVNFVNNSANFGSAMLFQTDDSTQMTRMFSLAWFCRPVYPGNQAAFSWNLDYWFVSGITGSLRPGVTFQISQVFPTSLNQNNQITFNQAGYGSYSFINPRTINPGQLSIVEDATITFGQAAVGIGMSGSGTFVAQAMPNTNIAFAPQPKYWIAFGNYQTGEVLDTGMINNRVEISFGAGQSSAVVTLNPNNTFSVSYS